MCFCGLCHYDVTFAVIEDTLVFRDGGDDPGFAYPAGEESCVKRALEFLMKYSEEQGYRLSCTT